MIGAGSIPRDAIAIDRLGPLVTDDRYGTWTVFLLWSLPGTTHQYGVVVIDRTAERIERNAISLRSSDDPARRREAGLQLRAWVQDLAGVLAPVVPA